MSSSRISRGVEKVKANESEVFNRVVSRTLYSKKIVIAVMLATIMVGSAFVVTLRGMATNPDDNPTVEGWNLEPWVDWTTGNVKRYLEGEVVPIRVTIPNPDASDGVGDRTIEIALDYYYESPGKPKYYGFETAVPYRWGVDNPTAPYDAGSGDQFSVPDATQGTVKSVSAPVLVVDGQETRQVWTITVTFADGAPQIYLKTGGLLALSTGTTHGASWYPGASLHFALENEGRRTVSVFVDGALAPPSLTVEKSCTPDHVAENDFMTIQLIIENFGQADAKNLMVVDKMPMIPVFESPEDLVPVVWVDLLRYVQDTTWFKTSENPIPQRWLLEPVASTEVDDRGTVDPTDDQTLRVYTWNGYPLADNTHRGTGAGGSLKFLVVTIWFQVSVVNPGERNFEYTNYAEVSYDDGHEGDYDPAWDTAPFWVIQPAIEITKRAFMRYDQKETSIYCAAAPYDSGDVNAPALGDWITFEITVSNPSLDWNVDQFWVTDAAIAAQQPDYNGDDVIWYAGADIPHAWLDGEGILHMNSFTAYFNYQITGSEEEVAWPSQGSDPVWVNHANVLAKDLHEKHYAENGADWWINILHPDARIIKTADIEHAAIVIGEDGKFVVNEQITYTFLVENLGDAPLLFALCDPMFKIDPAYSDVCENSFAGNSEPTEAIPVPVPLAPWYNDDGTKRQDLPPSWMIERTWTYVPPEAPQPAPGGEPAPPVPPPNPITNTVTLCAWDLQDHKLKRTSTEEVDVVHPGFSVVKRAVDPDDPRTTGDSPPGDKGTVGPDMMVLYEITVTNTGDSPLYFFYTDSNSPMTPDGPIGTPPPPLPWDFDPPYADEDQLWNGLLAVRQSETKYWWYEVQPSDIIKAGDEPGDPHVGQVKNTVTVTAWWNNDDEEHRLKTLPPQSYTCYVEVTWTAAGTVFNDVGAGSNAYDGVMEGDEVGLANFWVELHYAKETSPGVWVEDTGHLGGSLYKWMASKTSDNIGDYFFDELLPGDFIVKVRTVAPYPGTDPVPPENYFSTGATRYVLHQVGGDVVTDKDFPLAEYSEILGFKWLDRNMNGEWDDEEKIEAGLNGWTITLGGFDYDNNPVTMTSVTATINDPRSTDEPPPQIVGAYYFTQVKPGKYTITETVKDGWHATTDTRHPTLPIQWFIVADGQLYDQCHNFGNVPMRDIEGYKFYDKNMNGIWNKGEVGGEPALQYFTMKLYKANDPYKAVLDPATDYSFVASTVTDADGWYQFEDVTPGKYMIKEGFPATFPYGAGADWFITNPEDQTFDDLWTTMWDPPVDPLCLPDLGNMRYAHITGFHFHDYWGNWGDGTESPGPSVPPAAPIAAPNHHKEAGEPGLSGMGVNLYKWNDVSGWVLVPNSNPALDWTTYASGTGKFNLKVVPGDYRIEGELGVDWWWTTSSAYEFSVPAIYYSPDALVFRGDFGHALSTGLDPELSFFLEPGWNLWSVPMIVPGGLTAAGLLDAVGPNGVAVSKLDSATGEYQMYVVGDTTGDFPIVLGEGYYVFVTDQTRFSLLGELVYSQEIGLLAGWNIIGFSELGSMMASELLTHVTGCYAMAVSFLDPVTGEYTMYVDGDGPLCDFVVGAGSAYYLWVDGPGLLVIGK